MVCAPMDDSQGIKAGFVELVVDPAQWPFCGVAWMRRSSAGWVVGPDFAQPATKCRVDLAVTDPDLHHGSGVAGRGGLVRVRDPC
jgi:hypothetical protein